MARTFSEYAGTRTLCGLSGREPLFKRTCQSWRKLVLSNDAIRGHTSQLYQVTQGVHAPGLVASPLETRRALATRLRLSLRQGHKVCTIPSCKASVGPPR